MTHDELDRIGPELQQRCNDEIAKRFPTWSRYAVDQMLERTMDELAPDWTWIRENIIGSAPRIMLLQYDGPIDETAQ